MSAWGDSLDPVAVPQATLFRGEARLRIPVMRPNERIGEPHIPDTVYNAVCEKLGGEDGVVCLEGKLPVSNWQESKIVGVLPRAKS